MTADTLHARVQAVTPLPGRWTTPVSILSGTLLGLGLFAGLPWLIVVGVVATLAWNVAYLPPVCDWRYERRRLAVIRAWHAEHPDATP